MVRLRARHPAARVGWCWAALILVLASPLFLTDIPPVTDYPNHLARAYVLQHLPDDPVLSQIFAAHWRILPNLALDLLLQPLVRLLPIELAGRVALAAALLLPLAAAALYNRALFGRVSLWPLGSALIAYNGVFLLGLINFTYAVAAAFATAALWLAWRERAPRATVLGTAIGATIVFFCHVTGLLLLAILIGAYEIDRWWSVREPPGRFIGRRVVPAAAIILPSVALYALSPTATASGPTVWLPWIKPYFLLAPLINYDFGLDLGCGLFLLLLLSLALRWRWLVMPRSTAIAGGLLLAFVVFAPYSLHGGAFLDFRFVLPLGLMPFAGMRGNETADRAARSLAIGAMVALFAVRFAVIVQAWHGQEADLAAWRDAVRPITPGSRVLVAIAPTKQPPAFWASAPRNRMFGGVFPGNVHAPALYLVQQRAYFETFFSDPAQQPIVTLPAYQASGPDGAAWPPPKYDLLGEEGLSGEDRRGRPYLDGWWRKFDYVLVVNAGGMPDAAAFLPRCLEPLSVTTLVAVYRVRPNLTINDAGQCAAGPGT